MPYTPKGEPLSQRLLSFDSGSNPPTGCHYRWYEIAEICMILSRFDSIVFIGDETLQTIYNGLNILLRQDLSLGALDPLKITGDDIQKCKCDNQFIKDSCSKYAITSSQQVSSSSSGYSKHYQRPYACQLPPHALLPIIGSPAAPETLKTFHSLVPRAPPSVYKPIPIIHSITSTLSTTSATSSLQEFLSLADASQRKTPMLWVGPAAAGHLDIRARAGNQQIWQFASEMAKVAKDNDVECLGIWNMTVQANSWDGKRFGESVAIVQAMMVSQLSFLKLAFSCMSLTH